MAAPGRTRTHELAMLPTLPASKVWNQHNTGTGTSIGGDVHGGVTFDYGGGQMADTEHREQHNNGPACLWAISAIRRRLLRFVA